MKLYSIEHNFDKLNINDAYKSLLTKWWFALCDHKCSAIENAKVSFKIYKFFDYYDQNYLKDIIKKEYINKSGELYWAGDKYETVDELFNALAEQKLFAELVVEEI